MNTKTTPPEQSTHEDSTLPLVLILCTGNSCRSQMGEGFLKNAAIDFLEVGSAGSEPAGFVHPLALKVMAEIGIDISAQRSKTISEFRGKNVHTIITVCGTSDGACPTFPGNNIRRHHWPFDDPANAEGSEEERLAVFRKIRDKMRPVFEAYAAGRKDGFRGREGNS